MSHVFGPVPSRRLGRSLGVDLVPFKTCTYDCIYCQLGRTTAKTIERREWVPLREVLADIGEKLSSKPDYITLFGSGEPTLYSRTDELIEGIKALTDIPVAVLTNGSLLWQPEVRRQLLGADLVIPSLDAGDEENFRLICRPHEAITFDRMLSGLMAFREEFQGQYWLEVFLLAEYAASEAAVKALARCVDRIHPSHIQLNTVTRPPTEKYAKGISSARMEELAALFDPPAEVIADYHGVHEQSEFRAGRAEIMELLRRRPCSREDVAGGLGMHLNEVNKYLEELKKEGALVETWTHDRCYYSPADRDPQSEGGAEST